MLYVLDSDHYSAWSAKPCYLMGKRWGSSGCCAGLPSFPDHLTAIRATLDPSTMPLISPSHYALTAPDILDLRASVRNRTPDVSGAGLLGPCVRYNATLDGYELHQGGNALCWHRDLAVIAALLRAERFEPGWLVRALNSADLADHVILGADAREEMRRRTNAARANAKASEIAAEEARRIARRAPTSAPDDLSLDDLLA